MPRLILRDRSDDYGLSEVMSKLRASRMERLQITLVIIGGKLLPDLMSLKDEPRTNARSIENGVVASQGGESDLS